MDNSDNKLQFNTWDSRNKVVKIYKTKGKFGWMHLVVGEIKEGIPDEITDFVKTHPEFTKNLIKVNLEDPNGFFEFFHIIDTALKESGDRLKIAFKEVVKKIAKQDAKAMQELSDLMDKWKLHQITSLASIIQSRLETINNFEALIHDEGTYEIAGDNSIHRVLDKSMWLIDEDYWIVQSNKSLRTFIGDEIAKVNPEYKSKRPDFACATYQNKLIIEIKRPSLELTKKELDQAELYLRLISKYKAEKYSGIEIYLVGNKISSEGRPVIALINGAGLKTSPT